MKVKILKRNPEDYVRETKQDIHKLPRNYDPDLHPFEEAREYQRAVNAVKLERVFAKPFLGSLDGHKDGVSTLAKNPKRLARIASGACDGQIRLWDLSTRKCVRTYDEHTGEIRGLCFTPDGTRLLAAGNDKQISFWRTEDDEEEVTKPEETIASKSLLTGLTYHRREPRFATCGETSTLWDAERRYPLKEFRWGVDSIKNIKFNQVEENLLGACARDRSIILYDIREESPMRKVVLTHESNAIAWNPMEAFVFSVANEDYNLYSFDLRNLSRPLNVLMDHTSAVMDLDYAPTGKEIVAGSYDKTVRIFKVDQGHSREIYHTKRMQRVMCVEWSLDNKYILSASDEMNIRIWKAKAAEKLGIIKERQRVSLDYAEKLKDKYGSHPQLKRISRHRHVPRHVRNAQKEHKIIKESQKRKEANRRKHSKPGAVPYVAERDKHVLKEYE